MSKKVEGAETSKWGSVLNAVKGLFKTIGAANVGAVIKVCAVVITFVFVGACGYFIYKVSQDDTNRQYVLEKIAPSQREEEKEMKIRDDVTVKISHELNKMLYSLEADRVCIFELHNGKKNATSLPFRYADMSYEKISEERSINYVSDSFQDLCLTHYKIPYFLAQKGFFACETQELRDIDPRFEAHVEKTGGKYFASIILKSSGATIGFLSVFYDNEETIPPVSTIEAKLKVYSQIIAPLLDLNVQKKLTEKKTTSQNTED